MKKFLLVYSNSLGSREKLVRVLNSIQAVKNWRYDMPNCFYLITEMDPKELINAIRHECGDNGRCIIVEMTDFHGWLPPDTWSFLRKNYGDDTAR